MHVSYRYHSLPWHRIQATSWQRKMLPLQNQFSKVRLLFFMPASFHLVNWYFNIFLCKGSFILSQLLELSTELCPLNYFTIIYLTGYWLTVHRAQPTELFSISLACPRRQKKMFSRWGSYRVILQQPHKGLFFVYPTLHIFPVDVKGHCPCSPLISIFRYFLCCSCPEHA